MHKKRTNLSTGYFPFVSACKYLQTFVQGIEAGLVRVGDFGDNEKYDQY
jgi:hypothetical protein